jgi:hypothetical protein
MMLVSTLIEKLEKLKRERGDLPVYTEIDFEVSPLATVSSRVFLDESAKDCDLQFGQPYVCVY